MKDVSGSCAVFTEQGSSASQMTAAKVTNILPRLPAGCARCSHPGQNGRFTVIVENSEVRVSRFLDTSTKTQMA